MAQDITETFASVQEILEDMYKSLPALETMVSIFGDSEIQLLKDPLVEIYINLISLGLRAIKLFTRSTFRTFRRSIWSPLKGDFSDTMTVLTKAGKLVDRVAHVEHMYASNEARKEQKREMQNQERFRSEVRQHMRQVVRTSVKRDPCKPFNDSPSGFMTANFIGRDEELKRLRTIYAVPHDDIPTRCAIWGMPGQGKTQLALKYANSVFDSTKGPSIFWISATSTERLHSGFSKILNLVNHTDQDSLDHKVRLKSAQRWLEGAGQRDPSNYILILDNVDQGCLPFLREYLPRCNPHGSILFTTRTRDVATAITRVQGKHDIIALEAPNEIDAITILLTEMGIDYKTASREDHVRARELTSSVGRLPIAIDQAASFVNQYQKDLDYLLSLYKKDDRKMQMLSWENRLSTYEQSSVYAIFQSKFEELDVISPEISRLLKILSFFDPEGIPVDLLTIGADGLADWGHAHIRKQASEGVKQMKMDIERRSEDDPQPTSQLALISSSSATFDDKDTSTRPSLREKIKTKMKRESRSQASTVSSEKNDEVSKTVLKSPHEPNQHAAVEICSNSDDDDEGDMDGASRAAATIAGLMQDLVAFPMAIQQLQNLALLNQQATADGTQIIIIHDLVHAMIRDNAKKECLEEVSHKHACAIIDRALFRVHAPDDPSGWDRTEQLTPHVRKLMAWDNPLKGADVNLCHAIRNCVLYLRGRGRFDEAGQIVAELLPLQKHYFGENDSEVLRCEFQLAHIWCQQGRYNEAEDLYRKIVTARTTSLGPKHPHTLNALQGLADVYRLITKHEDAERMYREVLAASRETLGERHHNTLIAMNNLGLTLSARGKYLEAKTYHRASLDGLTEDTGSDDADTLASCANLAEACRKLRQDYEAEFYFKRCLSAWKRRYGQDHPATLACECSVAAFYEEHERWDSAAMLFKEVLMTREKSLGSNCPDVLKDCIALARVYRMQGRHSESKVLGLRAYKGLQQHYGDSDESTLGALNFLAILHQDEDDLSEAEALFKKVLKAKVKLYGPDDPVTMLTVQWLGALKMRQGHSSTAEKYHRRAMIARKKALESDADNDLNVDMLQSMRDLADAVNDLGRSDEAEDLYKECLAGFEKALGESSRRTIYVVVRLAILCTGNRRFVEAESYYKRALAFRMAKMGHLHVDTLRVLDSLGFVVGQQGRPEEAEKYYTTALDGREKVFGFRHSETLNTLSGLVETLQEQRKDDEVQTLKVKCEEHGLTIHFGGK
ncbi:hypothetical protein MMC09_004457 [Bachmanniomyces sp. S44760]|nr:hypothetical protein [Bachmanniomyces sp. S44760]